MGVFWNCTKRSGQKAAWPVMRSTLIVTQYLMASMNNDHIGAILAGFESD